MRLEFLHGLNAAAESRWKCSARTYQNECSKHILRVGNFQIPGFHLNLSKGNFFKSLHFTQMGTVIALLFPSGQIKEKGTETLLSSEIRVLFSSPCLTASEV